MILNEAQLARLRQVPHRSDLYLSIYDPTILFQAQVNDVNITKDARTIPYDNVTVGAYTDIFANAQMLVSSSSTFSRTSIIGTVRVRSANASQIVVAENSHIDWRDNLYFRILNYVDVEAIYPRIIQNPSDEENVIFYKDYDIAYTNQNSLLGALTCAGPHRAGFVGEQHYWSASGTTHVAGHSMTYSWIFEGGTPTGSNAHTPGYVTYNTPGQYKTILAVTGASGTVDTTYRFVSVYDRPELGGSPPIKKWEITSIDGSRSAGGYTATIKIRDAVSINNVQDNALVVIFGEDWYRGTKVSYGGNALHASDIFFVGYILKGSISYNYQDNYVEFNVGSVSEVMKLSEGFSVSCESKTSPTTWFEIKDLTVLRALYHYLRWHSTVLQVADFEYTGDDRSHQYFDTDRSSLYDAIYSFMFSALIGEVVCDRQGKIWAEISASATHLARTAFPVALDLQKSDWMGTPNIEDRQARETSFIEMGGVVYATGTSTALLANAPGDAPAYRGRAESIEGLILTSQTQLNQLVGDVFAFKNSHYPSISLELKGNYSNLDIAPLERVSVTIAASDTPRKITFTDEPYFVDGMSWRYDPRTKVKIPTMQFTQLVNGRAGDTIPVPPIPTGNDTPPINTPPIIPGGGGGTASILDYAYVMWNGDGNDPEEASRNITIVSYTQLGGTYTAEYVVNTAGIYLAGVYGAADQNGITAVDRVNVSITIGDSSFHPWTGYVPQQDSLYPTSGNIRVGAVATTMGLLVAGTHVLMRLSKGSASCTTLANYSWIVKLSS